MTSELAIRCGIADGPQQQLLDGLAQQFPELATAFRVKEAFHALYECESRRAAEQAATA